MQLVGPNARFTAARIMQGGLIGGQIPVQGALSLSAIAFDHFQASNVLFKTDRPSSVEIQVNHSVETCLLEAQAAEAVTILCGAAAVAANLIAWDAAKFSIQPDATTDDFAFIM